MINYNSNTIKDWNYGSDNIAKVYRDGDVVYQKVIDNTTPPSPSGLPSGYTEVEYVQNISGNTTPTSTTKNNLAFIDTNFIPTEKTRTVVDLQIIQASKNPRYFGSGKWNSLGYIVSQEWTVGEERARIYCKFGNSSGWIQTDYVPTLDRHTFDLNNNGKLVIDNVDITTLPTTSFTCTSSIGLFTATRTNDTYVDLGETVFAKLYSAKIYEDGILVRDFVPCTRDSDGVAGVYDIVNNQFYGSANSKPLVAGPTV